MTEGGESIRPEGVVSRPEGGPRSIERLTFSQARERLNKVKERYGEERVPARENLEERIKTLEEEFREKSGLRTVDLGLQYLKEDFEKLKTEEDKEKFIEDAKKRTEQVLAGELEAEEPYRGLRRHVWERGIAGLETVGKKFQPRKEGQGYYPWSTPETTGKTPLKVGTTEGPVQRSENDRLSKAIENLSISIGDLKARLEQGGLISPGPTPEEIMTKPMQMILEALERQTAMFGDTLGRVDPRIEKSRWVDAECSQEFYTRFTPTMEPRFYKELRTSEDRDEWDARWRLARAAFIKKICSGQPDKLIENQDLIELTKEQMETLYGIPGVKEALQWYVKAIVRGETRINGETILDCESGKEFKKFREKLREHLQSSVFGITPDQRSSMTEEESIELESKLKSVDAIAWNWIFCSNLVESIDSRYSFSGTRHDHLAPALCSDDLRAVFHPQEKFENKCLSGLEWGAFGKWGQIQVEKIIETFGFKDKEDKIFFKAAPSREKFWMAKIDGDSLIIYTPECYPSTSLKSFFEEYKDGKKGRPLLQRLLDGEDIHWAEVQADLWKTSYVTVRLRKAVALAEYFAGRVPFEFEKEGKDREWVIPLLDIFRRLHLDNLGKEEFHNLKSWVLRASLGGVKKPNERTLTEPPVLSPGDLPFIAIRLRNARLDYLERGSLGDWNGEGLDIW